MAPSYYLILQLEIYIYQPVMFFKKLWFCITITLISFNLFSQEIYKDTLNISLHGADSLFIQKNLALLAEKCNIDAAKAQIIQARLFQNPSITIDQNVYNSEYKTNGGRKWFDYTDKGETSVQIDKLFLLAGKRNKQIRLAELAADKEGHIYFDLVRTLKFSLHSCFFDIYFLNRILKVYNNEIVSVKKLIDVSEAQYSKEFISKKELLRLKANLFSLENEKLDYSTQLTGRMGDLNLLLHTSNVFYSPQADLKAYEKISPASFRIQSLIDTALVSRYDLKMAQADLSISKMNLDYQKALAVPDLTISGGWDRNGSFIHNYNYLGLQTALPLFNRNQGNIKSAKFLTENSRYKLESAEEQVKADVISSYAGAIETNSLYESFDKKFLDEMDMMSREMLKNYEKRNVSLVEFIDYYDAYKENTVGYYKLLFNRINSFENINYSVGKEIMR